MSSKDKNTIIHILKYSQNIEKTIDRFGNEEAFYQDRDYRDAISMNILQIGELTKKLSNEYVKNNSQVPWRDIMKTRDLFAHHYGHVDSQELWLIASMDIPQLKEFCLQEVEQFNKQEHSIEPQQSHEDEDDMEF